MKRSTLICLMALLSTSCHRKDDNGNPTVSTMPGSCGAAVTHYTGAINVLNCAGTATCEQTVTINADVLNHPNDVIGAYLCQNATCDASNLPSKTCTQALETLATGAPLTTPCYTTVPSTNIVYATNAVNFVNAFQPSYWDLAQTQVQFPGYTSYAIDTVVCR